MEYHYFEKTVKEFVSTFEYAHFGHLLPAVPESRRVELIHALIRGEKFITVYERMLRVSRPRTSQVFAGNEMDQ